VLAGLAMCFEETVVCNSRESFEKMWSYLCVLGGMGYAGGPIAGLGGWGDGGVPLPNFTYAPIPRYSVLNAAHGVVQIGDQHDHASIT
jgi:hypothetical protein